MHILVPVKNTSLAKSRLSGVLPPGQRRILTLHLLRVVLTALTDSPEVNKVGALIYVVSDDTYVKEIACDFRVKFIDDNGCDDLNTALRIAAQSLVSLSATTLWVFPSDLPRIKPEDVDALLLQSDASPGVTIAPDACDQGTNALGISPPGLIDFSFGPGSFDRHCSAAHAKQAGLTILRRPGLSFDLDTPEDLSAYARDPACYGRGQGLAYFMDH